MSDTQDGWVNTEEDNSGTWYYYEDGEVTTGWKYINGNWYYFNKPGGSMTWSNEVDGYYLGVDGKMVTDEKWVNTEEDNSGTWYYVGSDEKVVTGWNKIGDDFYYFNHPGGSMTWDNTIDGFYLDNGGKMVSGTGWLKDEYSGEWYYFSDGSMAHNDTIGGYHVDNSGKMITGTGWVPSDGSWYYLKDDGEVATNWQYINDNWYYFYKEEGSMAKDTTIEGYSLNDNGEWAPNDDSIDNNISNEVTDEAAATYDGSEIPTDGTWTQKEFLESAGRTWLKFGDSVSQWQYDHPNVMKTIGIGTIAVGGWQMLSKSTTTTIEEEQNAEQEAIEGGSKAEAEISGGVCFTEETLVLTKDGHIHIKDIKIGDEVYSQNQYTGEKGLKKVTDIFVNETDRLVHITIKETEIKATPTHPFWVVDKGWVVAEELEVGDNVQLYSGEVIEITSLKFELIQEHIKVYNFEVEEWHTYYVSNRGVLVHNTCSEYVPNNPKWVGAGTDMWTWAEENNYKLSFGGGTDIGKMFVSNSEGEVIGEIHSGQLIDRGVNAGKEVQIHFEYYFEGTTKTDDSLHLYFED